MTTPPQTPPAHTSPKNGVGYAALALGILALITSALLVGLLFGSLAVTLGLAGLETVADNEATNRKSAIAAVVLGVVAIIISLVALVFRIWLIV
jgi:hypothetical protein